MRGVAHFNRNAQPPPIYHEEIARHGYPPREEQGLPASEITLAELLRERGYHTLHFGKWHLGEVEAFRPEAQGFDESLGFYSGASMFLPEDDPDVVNSKQDFDPIDQFLWANLPFAVRHNGSEPFAPSAYMTDYLADEAVRAIDANRNRPVLPVPRLQRAAHAAPGAEERLRRARRGIENHTDARLRRDDAAPRPRAWAACSTRCAQRASRRTRWCSSPATTAAPTTSACRTSTSRTAAGR